MASGDGSVRRGSLVAAGEIAAKFVGTATLLVIAQVDRGDVDAWVWPVAFGLQTVIAVLVAHGAEAARRASGILDVGVLLTIAAATSSPAARIGIFGGLVFFALFQPPRWAWTLSAATGAGTAAVALIDGELIQAVLLAANATWLAAVVGLAAGHRDRGAARAHELEAARTRLIEEGLAADLHARLSIGADVHDGPLQLLVTAIQDLDDVDGPVAAGAQDLLRDAVVELRRIIAAGEPETEPGRVAAILGDWCTVLASRRRFRWSISIDPELAHIHPLAVAAARELVTNAAKHARLKVLSITIRRAADDVVVEVADDGIGIGDDVSPGFGLPALRRRATLLGGTLSLLSRPGGGTLAVVRLPAVVREPVAASDGSVAVGL